MTATILYTTLIIEFLHKREDYSKYVAYTLTLVILWLLGFGRLYLGENYPHQILLGLCYGFIYVTLCFAFDKKLLKLSVKSCFNWEKNRKNLVYWFGVTIFLLLGVVATFDVITLARTTNISWKLHALNHCNKNYSVGGAASFYQSSWIFYNLGLVAGCMNSSRYLTLFWWHTPI